MPWPMQGTTQEQFRIGLVTGLFSTQSVTLSSHRPGSRTFGELSAPLPYPNARRFYSASAIAWLFGTAEDAAVDASRIDLDAKNLVNVSFSTRLQSRSASTHKLGARFMSFS